MVGHICNITHNRPHNNPWDSLSLYLAFRVSLRDHITTMKGSLTWKQTEMHK